MPEPVQSLVLVLGVAFVAAAALTPLVARLAVAWGWMDHPDGDRKRHRTPVPAVGGVAVLGALVLAGATLQVSERQFLTNLTAFRGLWAPIVAGALAVGVIGLLDDARGVRPLSKVIVQTAAALYLYASGFQVTMVTNPFGGSIELGALALPVTVLWLVGMSNAFNLIDGLDGLAAGLALVSTLGLLAAAVASGRWETALVAGALAGALAGFLPYNFSPARVFLGDSGALPVGFVLGAIAVKSSIKASAAIAVAVPLLALALPILDVALAIVRRIVRRRPLFEGDRDHIHHRLVDMGLTPRRAVVTLYGVATLFSALALAIAMGPRLVIWAAGALALLVVWAGVRALGYWEVTEFQRSFLTRIVAGLRASGDAALRGAEHDIARLASIEEGWDRLAETAWELGLTELHLRPVDGWRDTIPEIHRVRPPETSRAGRADPPAAAAATWSIEVDVVGPGVANVMARRPLERMDFDPARFVALVRATVRRPLAAAPRVSSMDTAMDTRVEDRFTVRLQ